LTPKERVLSFQDPDVCAKFRRNPFKIATVRARTHTHTHTHTHRDHTSDPIICPMLCYSNGTDKNTQRWVFQIQVFQILPSSAGMYSANSIIIISRLIVEMTERISKYNTGNSITSRPSG